MVRDLYRKKTNSLAAPPGTPLFHTWHSLHYMTNFRVEDSTTTDMDCVSFWKSAALPSDRTCYVSSGPAIPPSSGSTRLVIVTASRPAPARIHCGATHPRATVVHPFATVVRATAALSRWPGHHQRRTQCCASLTSHHIPRPLCRPGRPRSHGCHLIRHPFDIAAVVRQHLCCTARRTGGLFPSGLGLQFD